MDRVLIAGLALCLLSPGAGAGEPAPLAVSDAWVRALPPGQPATAAYLTLSNTGTEALAVVAGSTPVASRVEFHRTREVEGYQRMERLEQLELDPGQRLELAPGGTHLMLLDLERMPSPGERIPLCLQLSTGDGVCADAEVRKTAGPQGAHHHHQ